MIGTDSGWKPSRSWLSTQFISLLTGIALATSASAYASSSEIEPAALTIPAAPGLASTDNSGLSSLPSALSAADAVHYATIFQTQETGDWAAADAELAASSDKTLTGSVLAQRYLSKHYQPSFAELSEWLASYGDQPEAHAIWSLALHHTAGRPLPSPAADRAPGTENSFVARLFADPSPASLQRPREFSLGLTAWHEQRWADAARNFEAVASTRSSPSWYVSAGAYWAARTHLKLKDPEHVDTWLQLAARQPRTFYGLLAREELGLVVDPAMTRQALSPAQAAPLMALSGGKRALELLQIGQVERGQAELRALSIHATGKLADSIVALADTANMPSVSLALGGQTTEEMPIERALYPMPQWQPHNGFSVDRALIYALILEESRFNAGAQSGSGAAGLMQLMPATARSIARSSGIEFHGNADLINPETNMSLGQEYVKQLLHNDEINGNLILAVAAYNLGPAALPKWRAQSNVHDDPLLFIEDLPRGDTRLYVQRVLTSLWIYRQRLGQKVPDLAALAANLWPNYLSMDETTVRPTQYAASR